MNDIHELLPWYVNQTLESGEASAFKEHLPECGDCRSELAMLEQMRDRLKTHGEELLSNHPSPKDLMGALAYPEEGIDLEPQLAAKIRRHVALCTSCAGEASTALSDAESIDAALESVFPGPVAPAALGGFLPKIMPWGWAVAAALVVLLFALPRQQESGATIGSAGLNPPHRVEPAERAGGAPSLVKVERDAEVIPLMFPIDISPEALPLTFEIMGSDGKTFYRNASIPSERLFHDLFLFLDVRPAVYPDGDYVARLTPGDDTPPTEYPFRVTRR